MSELGMLGLALFVLALIIALITWWLIRYLLIRLPEQQKDILDRFSLYVVNQASLEYASLPEIQQKHIACEKMRTLFEDHRLASPGDAMLEAAIAHALSQRKMQEANEWIEELKADQIAQSKTREIPITPMEEEWIL
jgi:hypothetical protein